MIGRNIVHFYVISNMLASLWEAQLHDGGVLLMDTNCERSVKQYVSTWILPHMQKWKRPTLEALQLALAFYIRKDPEKLETAVLDGMQELEMMEPEDVRRFFVWVYEAVFPLHPLREVDINLAVVDNDPLDANTL
jgi:hypothetical protein